MSGTDAAENRPSWRIAWEMLSDADELAARGADSGVARQLAAQLGEQLVWLYFDNTGHSVRSPEPGGGFDLVVDGRQRVEVKTARRDTTNSRAPAVTLRSLNFDELAVVVLGSGIGRVSMFLVRPSEIRAFAKTHKSGFTLRLSPAFAAHPYVRDVSDELRSLVK
ncbi:hypothetical protein [Actinospongicola halichondriae]|uniref:hypothetical protein n=1 Tax=Actinospongicola halichondriae TaxID=3236844 RepID=UPI003D418D1E